MEDRPEKRKAKKERQRSARAQAAAREAPSLAVGSSAAQQSPSSAQRSSLLSPELLAAEQKPGSPAQAGAPAVEAVLQAAGHVSAEPAEALPQPAPGEGRKTGKRKGKLSRSGALPSGSVHSAPPVQASPGVPRSDSTAAMPDPQNSIAKVTDEHVVALSSPAEPPESSPSASHSSSSAQRLRFPIHEASFAAHQPQDRGSIWPALDSMLPRVPRPCLQPLPPRKKSPGRRSGLAGANWLQSRQLPNQARVAVAARRCQRRYPDQQRLRQRLCSGLSACRLLQALPLAPSCPSLGLHRQTMGRHPLSGRLCMHRCSVSLPSPRSVQPLQPCNTGHRCRPVPGLSRNAFRNSQSSQLWERSSRTWITRRCSKISCCSPKQAAPPPISTWYTLSRKLSTQCVNAFIKQAHAERCRDPSILASAPASRLPACCPHRVHLQI